MQSWGLRGVQDSLVPPWSFGTTGFLLESTLPTEEHKPTLDHQLANLQVSGPVKRLDMGFPILYLAQGWF